jgi:hypothetical protein
VRGKERVGRIVLFVLLHSLFVLLLEFDLSEQPECADALNLTRRELTTSLQAQKPACLNVLNRRRELALHLRALLILLALDALTALLRRTPFAP